MEKAKYKILKSEVSYVIIEWEPLTANQEAEPYSRLLDYTHLMFQVEDVGGGCVEILGRILSGEFMLMNRRGGGKLSFMGDDLAASNDDVTEVMPVYRCATEDSKPIVRMVARK